jgi:hypothetical protein
MNLFLNIVRDPFNSHSVIMSSISFSVAPALIAAGIGVGANILGSIFGSSKKKAPRMAAPVDFSKAWGEAQSSNWKNMLSYKGLASETNKFNQSEALGMMETALPGIGQVRKQMLGAVQEDLTTKGLPKSISQNLSRKAAEMGLSRGTSGQHEQFNLLRDFGFNLVDWERARRTRAINTLGAIMQITPRPNPMSPSSMFAGGANSLTAAEKNRSAQQSYYNAEAAAENANRQSRANMISGIFGAVGGVAMSAAGGAFSGGGATGQLFGGNAWGQNASPTQSYYPSRPQ